MDATFYTGDLRALVAGLGWRRTARGQGPNLLQEHIVLSVAGGQARATVDTCDHYATRNGAAVAETVEPGMALLPGEAFAALLRRVRSEAVRIATSSSGVSIEAGELRARLIVGENARCETTEVPAPPNADGVTLECDALELARVLRNMLPFASTDESRMSLNGVTVEVDPLIDTVEPGQLVPVVVMATEGHRASVVETAWKYVSGRRVRRPMPRRDARDNDEVYQRRCDAAVAGDVPSAILHSEGLRLFAAALAKSTGTARVTLFPSYAGGRWGTWSVDGASFAARQIDDVPPPWRKVMPSAAPCTADVGRAEFLNAVRAVRSMTTARSTSCRVEIHADHVVLSVANLDTGEISARVEAEVAGLAEQREAVQTSEQKDFDSAPKNVECLRTCFRAEFLSEAVSSCIGSTTVRLGFRDQYSPVLVTGDVDDGYRHALMPMRL